MAQEESLTQTLEPPPPSPSIASTEQSAQTSVHEQQIDRSSGPTLSRNTSLSRLNARAPEFVPRSSNRSDLIQQQQKQPQPQRMVIQPAHVFPVQYQNYGGGFGDHEFVVPVQQVPVESDHPTPTTRNGLPDEVCHKVLNQVEYYFSDANLATTDHLIRFINKDPDGFVPMSVVASFKKIKALVGNHHQLATVLQKSSKLVVSDDGKKVRRQSPFTEADLEDLQSRIVVAENLPEDHSYQNLMRVFSVIGSVKTIRTCQPQLPNGGTLATSRSSKVENMFFSNKLHAFVEYETVGLAEKAVAELNDERNWRSGLRVRLLLKRTSKSAQLRTRKAGHEGEGHAEEDDLSTSEQQNDKPSDDHLQSSDGTSHEHAGEENVHDKEGGPRRPRGRGRGKGRGRGHNQHQHQHQHHNNRASHVGTPPANSMIHSEQPTATKQPPGPRMPDGTRGFAVGRGKPLVADNA